MRQEMVGSRAWPVLPWHVLTSFPRLLLAPAMIAIVLVTVAFPVKPASEKP